MSEEILVALEGAARAYGSDASSSQALTAATCQVRAGDRVAVVGPSGSGKSTLLHLMGGLDSPTTGRVRWPALGAREQLRPGRIGFVFQTPSLLPALTVQENVELAWLLSEQDAAEARPAAQRTLARLGLSALADKLPEELSGGQAQRAAVARALVCRPRLILADEPTGQLDRASARQLFDALLAGLEGLDTALIVATHDLHLAARMRSRWRLRHGVLEVLGEEAAT